MEFFLTNPDIERLPPARIQLLDLHAEPYSDGKRIRVALNLTPFQQKPYLELTLSDSDGEIVTTTSIVEPVVWNLELTLHIRRPVKNPIGVYKLTVILSFPDLGEVDRREINVDIPYPTVKNVP